MLDFSISDFEKYLDQACKLVLHEYQNVQSKKGFSGVTPSEVAQSISADLPEIGEDFEQVLQHIKAEVLDKATGNIGPHMYAYVMSGGSHVGIIAELLVASINQNVAKWHLAPALTEIEKRVVQWGAEFIGFPKDAGGIMVSGGSGANLTSLTVARNMFLAQQNIRKKGMYGMKPLRVYASVEVHGCCDKSVDMLGIGMDNLIKIPVNDDFQIDTDLLRQKIEEDINTGCQPFCIIGNAGTVNTGAVDDLEELATIADEYKMWYHIDGAYGALAAAVPRKSKLYQGMQRADSVAIDFHKWLYVPFEAGCALISNWTRLHQSYVTKASYLSSDAANDGRMDFNDFGFQLSRNSKALKVYMSFKTYGSELLSQAIDQDIILTEYLHAQIEKSEDFRNMHDVILGILCFQYTADLKDDEVIQKLNRDIVKPLEKDGRVFIAGTTIKGKSVLRACLINHRKTEKDIDYLLDVIREVGSSIS